MKKIAYYLVPVVLCLIVGFVAGQLQRDALEVWYPTLVKPALTPPPLVFPIAWGILYICMGISLGRLFVCGNRSGVILWFVQLAVNFLWSVLFFYLRSPLAGLIDIVVLDLLVIIYILHVRRCSSSAAWLFAPYLVWLLFATYLNGYIYLRNPAPRTAIVLEIGAVATVPQLLTRVSGGPDRMAWPSHKIVKS